MKKRFLLAAAVLCFGCALVPDPIPLLDEVFFIGSGLAALAKFLKTRMQSE